MKLNLPAFQTQDNTLGVDAVASMKPFATPLVPGAGAVFGARASNGDVDVNAVTQEFSFLSSGFVGLEIGRDFAISALHSTSVPEDIALFQNSSRTVPTSISILTLSIDLAITPQKLSNPEVLCPFQPPSVMFSPKPSLSFFQSSSSFVLLPPTKKRENDLTRLSICHSVVEQRRKKARIEIPVLQMPIPPPPPSNKRKREILDSQQGKKKMRLELAFIKSHTPGLPPRPPPKHKTSMISNLTMPLLEILPISTLAQKRKRDLEDWNWIMTKWSSPQQERKKARLQDKKSEM